jgi:dTDP-4-dehydrorhamnose reductase
VIGADGLLGRSLYRLWGAAGHPVAATALQPPAGADGIQPLDLGRSSDAWPVLPQSDAAVLCAGITSLQQCRDNPEATRYVNVTQTLALARQLADRGCFVVYISSNLVFDGLRPMSRADEPRRPATEYGRQKADVEIGLSQLGERAAVVRLTKVFHRGLPLVRGWIESLRRGQPITAFVDLVCSPISAEATVRAIAAIAERQLPGIWQLSGSGEISYAGIAAHVTRREQCDPALVHPTRASRNLNLEHLTPHASLDAGRASRELGFELAAPSTVLDRVFFAESIVN